jgi:hypothetical protein
MTPDDPQTSSEALTNAETRRSSPPRPSVEAPRPQHPGNRGNTGAVRPQGTRPVRHPAQGSPPREYTPPRPRPPSVPVSESGWYLPWWSLVVMVGVVGIVALGLLYAFSQLSQPHTPGNQLPRVQVITSVPTLSQDFAGDMAQPGVNTNPSPIPQALPSATVPLPTPIPSPTLPAGEFAIGMTVEVVGVDINGLNIRSSPGYDGTPRFLAAEGDAFVIVEGPQEADGLEWWRLEDPNDPERYGWAARNYLTVVSQ